MGKSKLKAALNTQQGRNIKLEKQRKHEKEVQKRKEKRAVEEAGQKAEGNEDTEDGGVPVPLDEVEVKVNGNAKKSNKGKKEQAKSPKSAPAVKEPEWETEGSEDEDDDASDDEDASDQPALNLAHLDDSESDISSDEEEMQAEDNEEEQDDDDEDAEDDDEEEEDDIALSDLDSVASEEKGDIIPHQRLTINNTAALTAALNRIQLPYAKLAFSEHQSVTTDEPVDIPDVEDDLNRELAFYKQCLSSVKDARKKLKKEGVSFSRPADYFAEMVKSDEHMGKIKQKLIDAAAGKKAAAEARKQRDLKKFGKQVQVAKMQERAKEKKDTMEKISTLKRKRQGADITSTNEEDLFDVAATADDSKSDRRSKGGDGKAFNAKRQKKDTKYGFGGKKRHAKSNDAKSSGDVRDFSSRKMKGKPSGGASKRPGKARRAKNH
ncbi:rrna processing protein ebp2 [Stemphylium lycopersici]|uniref:Rrna processing protein ebp2 n=1 Tax=Stemphylium lycopersici TaxID=183478 RepID=A0A364N7E5_STELY|nr:rrna processing protein ebp2 [Stemphylium lycopersici]RAR01680.1 rrna processing protein ebp2 [Stemphylium lycopersici]RAR13245.1 rrna processing protein ebp2 [Stemphylium lycopersici]